MLATNPPKLWVNLNDVVDTMIALDLMIICVAVLVATALVKRIEEQRELERHTIRPEELRSLLVSNTDVVLVDVRQPLDLIGDSVIIPGAVWFAPRQVLDDPSILPERKDLVVYCTCSGDRISLAVLHRALAMGFSRIKLLKVDSTVGVPRVIRLSRMRSLSILTRAGIAIWRLRVDDSSQPNAGGFVLCGRRSADKN